MSRKLPKNLGNIRKVSELSAQSTCQNESFVNSSEKIMIKLCPLFHMKTTVSLSYFVTECLNVVGSVLGKTFIGRFWSQYEYGCKL